MNFSGWSHGMVVSDRHMVVIMLSTLTSFRLFYCSPCADINPSCSLQSPQCVENKEGKNFACQRVQKVDNEGNCTVIPESQKLYLTTPVNISGGDLARIVEIAPKQDYYSEITLSKMFKTLTLVSSYIGPKLALFQTCDDYDLWVAVYYLMFTENITKEIKQEVARSVLLFEEVGNVTINNVTAVFVNYTGIYDTIEETQNKVPNDDVDWCASASLHSCSESETCRDVGLRYDCPCKEGYVNDGKSCTDIVIKSSDSLPFDTDGTRELHLFCDAVNTTDVTKYSWDSSSCPDRQDNHCIISPKPLWDDEKSISCTVSYKNGHSKNATFVIRLNYPPKSPPEIDGYSTGQISKVGDFITMRCSVYGGKPLVTSVNFTCPRHSDAFTDVIEASAVTSTLKFTLTSSDDGAICICSALWKSNQMYLLTTSIVLTVYDNGPDLLDYKWYIVFAVLALVVIAVVIIVIIICKMCGAELCHGNQLNSANTSSLNASYQSEDTSSASVRPLRPPGPHLTKYPVCRGEEPVPLSPWLERGQKVWRSLNNPVSTERGGADVTSVPVRHTPLRVQASNSLSISSEVYAEIGHVPITVNGFSSSGLSSSGYLHPLPDANTASTQRK